MNALTRVVSCVLFIGAWLLAGLAVWERLANVWGYTVLRDSYSPWRLLEMAAIVLLFVIALQLKQVKAALEEKSPGE